MAYALPIDATIEAFGASTLDAFGNLKVSEEYSIADYKTIFDKNSHYFDESLSGGATSTFVANASKVVLNCTGATQSATRQTYLLHPYQPGKGLGFKVTGILYTTANANFSSELGLLDDKNGVGFYYDGTDVGIIVRSYVTGSAVDVKVPQSSWNIDTCSDIDFTLTQIFVVQSQWLGVGSVTFAIAHNGNLRLVHKENHNNIMTDVYATTLSLPLRYKCSTNGGFSGSVSTVCICVEIFSQGGYNPKGDLRTVNRGISPLTVGTTETCILAIRAKSGFAINLVPDILDIITTTSDNHLYSIYIGGTVTGGAWVNVAPTNRSEYNITATSFTGNTKIISGYSSDQIRKSSRGFDIKEGAGVAINGTAIPIIVTVQNVVGNSDFLASLTFKELY